MQRRRFALWLVVGCGLWLGWRACGSETDEPGIRGEPGATAEATTPRARDTAVPAFARRAPRIARRDGEVMISGRVVEQRSGESVRGVEVIFRGFAGEESVTTGDDGRYEIALASGMYRAFVRDDVVMSVGSAGRVRLPDEPQADAIAAPVESAMPVVVASRDLMNVDLPVLQSGTVKGKVVDTAGRPVARAVLWALGGVRPALGTDLAESDANGAFELRLPIGFYSMQASHPRFAGVEDTESSTTFHVRPGRSVDDLVITLRAGCIISGRVVRADGSPAASGAIERSFGPEESFMPVAQIAADGTFRWTMTQEGDLMLRAWPFKSAHSEDRPFTCRDGARFSDVVFTIPDRAPDIAGTLTDAHGDPVPLAYIDLAPLDPGGLAQQERVDGDGAWGVYHMPPGRYRVTAHVEGRGVASAIVTAPVRDVKLALGGTGTVRGTTGGLQGGSFTMRLASCGGEHESGFEEQRLVNVVNGAFEIEDVPACALGMTAIVGRREVAATVQVPLGGVGEVALELGGHAVKVEGIVRDVHGQPVPNATVIAREFDDNAELVDGPRTTTDARGHYALAVDPNVMITASAGELIAVGEVTAAPGEHTTLDLELEANTPEEEFEGPSEGDIIEENGFDTVIYSK